jgi:hypothetical protein
VIALGLPLLGCTSHAHEDPADAGSDATIPSGDAAADASSDADADAIPACGPADVAAFVPTWDPPTGPHLGACTEAQLQALISACFSAFATEENCTAWEEEPANQACLGCWSGPVTATRWAPYLYVNNPGETDYVNVAGCVALADPDKLPCAEALEAAFQCELAACLGPCPVPNIGTPEQIETAEEALGDCQDRSDQGGCEALVAQGTACGVPLEDAGPAAFCFLTGRQTTALLQLFALVCGAKDGGPED